MSRRLEKAFKQTLELKQTNFRYISAVLGDGVGNVEVSGRTGYVYARVGNRVFQAYNIRVKAIAGMPVKIGYLPSQPYLLQVIDYSPQANNDYSGKPADTLPLHGDEHSWYGGDVSYVHIRQFLPLRLEPVDDEVQVKVHGAAVYASGTWVQVGTSSIDLLPARPITTGTQRWMLISLDEEAQFVITTGTETGGDLTYFDIPEPPSDYLHVVGAVRLHSETTEFAESKSGTDFADLRFPGRHRHPDYVVTGSQSGHIIQNEGVDLPTEDRLNFSSDASISMVAYDDPGNGRTTVYISGTKSGHDIQDEGILLNSRDNLNFVGDGVEAVDDPANNATIVYVFGVTGTFVSLEQIHEHVYQEDHTLACNGAKTNFITMQEYEPETTQVFLNGIRLRPGVGNSYVEDALYNSFTMAEAPEVDDELIVEYITA